ncbi:MAG: hypothetical protein K9K67_06475 [Bacteriovoracaceae bacterium]|nr:hypothetical protein [Bacteriovoracaceae bacterium]
MSKVINPLLDELTFYGDEANEETNLFNRRENWNKEDTLDEKYLEFLSPHSRPYFSRLRPLFSFEVKELKNLNSFSHVLFRDGVVLLLRFFQRFPEPSGFHSKIFIHEDLAFIIPKTWCESVLLYKTVTIGKKGFDKKDLVLILNLHELQDSDLLQSLVLKFKNDTRSLSILPFYNQMRGEDYLDYDRAESLEPLKDIFKGDVRVINYSQLGHLNERESVFINANPQKLFCSDSSVVHNFLRSGWKSPAIENVETNIDNIIRLSPNHGMTLSPFEVKNWQEDIRKRLFEELEFPKGSLFQEEPSLNRDLEDYFKVFYYSKDLMQLSRDLGRAMFLSKNGPR